MSEATLLTDRCVTLHELLAEGPPHQEPTPGFTGWFEGRPWRVTAVLTSLVDDQDRIVRRHDLVTVVPRSIVWRPKGIDHHRSPFLPPTDVTVARARRQYELERGRRNSRVASVRSGVQCSRPGCERELGTGNRSGMCTPCQCICPFCGGPKTTKSRRCLRCAEAGR